MTLLQLLQFFLMYLILNGIFACLFLYFALRRDDIINKERERNEN